jgi:hypothetical protein
LRNGLRREELFSVRYTYRVKKERAGTSVGRFLYGGLRAREAETAPTNQGGFSPLLLTAAISVVALLAIVGWDIARTVREKSAATDFVAQVSSDASASEPQNAAAAQRFFAAEASSSGAASSTDLISDIGPAVMDSLENSYAQMQAQGTYTTAAGEAAAQDLAPLVDAQVSYQTYSAADIKTDPDTSYDRMLTYRERLRIALAPLLKNTEPEYEIFAYYVQTKDPTYLAKLSAVAQNYRDAASSSAQVVVPQDAVSYQVAILNAMEEFAATLDAMAAHADDPFASVALLRTYDQAQNDMLTSFNNLATYYKSKTP